MSSFSVKRMNWLRTPSMWQSSQAWRERQASVSASFDSANSSANSAFANASVNQVAGMGQIVATVASQRSQKEQVAKALNALV
jgi:hypothetical protein